MDIDGKVDGTSAIEVEPSTDRIEGPFVLNKIHYCNVLCDICHLVASFNMQKSLLLTRTAKLAFTWPPTALGRIALLVAWPQKATAAEGNGRRRPRPQKATAAEGHGHRRPRPPRRSTSLRRGPGTVASNEARAMCWQGGMTASLEERPVDIFTAHDGFFACSQSSGLCFGVLGVRRHGHFSSLWRTSHLLADSNLLKKTWSQRR